MILIRIQYYIGDLNIKRLNRTALKIQKITHKEECKGQRQYLIGGAKSAKWVFLQSLMMILFVNEKIIHPSMYYRNVGHRSDSIN